MAIFVDVLILRVSIQVFAHPRNLMTEVLLWKQIIYFPSTLCLKYLKTQQLPAILDLCLRKTQSGKLHHFRDAIVFGKFRFQNVCRPHEDEEPAFSNSPARREFSKSSDFVTDKYGRQAWPWKFNQRSVDSALGVDALTRKWGYYTHSLPKASFVLFSLSKTSGSVPPPVSISPAALPSITIFIYLALE